MDIAQKTVDGQTLLPKTLIKEYKQIIHLDIEALVGVNRKIDGKRILVFTKKLKQLAYMIQR